MAFRVVSLWRQKRRICLCLLLGCSFVYTCVYMYTALRNNTYNFKTALEDYELRLLLRTFEKFDQLMTENNITYILEGGTLIGSFRHHGPIPWDDDLDVLVSTKDRGRLIELLPKIRPDFNFFIAENDAWMKFYDDKSNYLPNKPFRWPYVDIFFWEENGTHIYHEMKQFRHSLTAPKDKILPPVRRKYSHLWLPTPCNMEEGLLKQDMDITECISSKYSHKYEAYWPTYNWAVLPCVYLRDKFPFVHRQKLSDGSWIETLKIGDKIIHSLKTPKYC